MLTSVQDPRAELIHSILSFYNYFGKLNYVSLGSAWRQVHNICLKCIIASTGAAVTEQKLLIDKLSYARNFF